MYLLSYFSYCVIILLLRKKIKPDLKKKWLYLPYMQRKLYSNKPSSDSITVSGCYLSFAHVYRTFFLRMFFESIFWKHINNFIRTKINIDITLNKKNILVGLSYSEFPTLKRATLDFINEIILIGKLCISKFRYGQIKNLPLLFEIEYSLRYNH